MVKTAAKIRISFLSKWNVFLFWKIKINLLFYILYFLYFCIFIEKIMSS